jgi:hypothetical protein
LNNLGSLHDLVDRFKESWLSLESEKKMMMNKRVGEGWRVNMPRGFDIPLSSFLYILKKYKEEGLYTFSFMWIL